MYTEWIVSQIMIEYRAVLYFNEPRETNIITGSRPSDTYLWHIRQNIFWTVCRFFIRVHVFFDKKSRNFGEVQPPPVTCSPKNISKN